MSARHELQPRSWSDYAPAVGALVGAFGEVSAEGRYLRVGKLVHFRVAITITTNGTASAAVSCSLPVPSADTFVQTASGREVGVTGAALNAEIANNDDSMLITTSGAAYPGDDGHVLVVSGAYEAA